MAWQRGASRLSVFGVNGGFAQKLLLGAPPPLGLRFVFGNRRDIQHGRKAAQAQGNTGARRISCCSPHERQLYEITTFACPYSSLISTKVSSRLGGILSFDRTSPGRRLPLGWNSASDLYVGFLRE